MMKKSDNESRNLMFDFITKTWNPLGGECPHQCVYCWARQIAKRNNLEKYQGESRLIEKELNRKFKEGEFVFVQDMSDLFAWDVPEHYIEKILNRIKVFTETKFLLLTKNPERYKWFCLSIPENCVLGATIESNGWVEGNTLEGFYKGISCAPHPHERIDAMIDITGEDWGLPHKTLVSIEPILDFDLGILLGALKLIQPTYVAIGYDNYGHCLPEPSLRKTLKLIEELEKFTMVHRKTLRPAWYEERGLKKEASR